MRIPSLAVLLFLVLMTAFVGCNQMPASSTAPSAPAIPSTPVMAATAPTTTAAAGDDYCFKCHEVLEGTSVTFKNDIHYKNSISCADCHGGNPKVNDMDLSKTPQSGFRLRIERQDVPTFCAGCHSNAKFMALYRASLPTNQDALYARSIHGIQLAAGNTEAAECIDCHGIHDIRPASDPQSSINARNLPSTCANCHNQEATLLRGNRTHANRTNCVMCHTGGHSIQKATTALLTGANQGCGRCHRGNTGPARTAQQIAQLIANLENAGPNSKDALAQARRAVHSFNFGNVQRAANTPATRPAGAAGGTTRPAGGRSSVPVAAPAPENDCLRCHPFDKVIAASLTYVTADGDKTNPHLYVPHDSKDEKDIPDCSHCHPDHPLDPLPAKGSIDLSKVGVQWCFDACHHEKNFEPCGKCH